MEVDNDGRMIENQGIFTRVEKKYTKMDFDLCIVRAINRESLIISGWNCVDSIFLVSSFRDKFAIQCDQNSYTFPDTRYRRKLFIFHSPGTGTKIRGSENKKELIYLTYVL